MDAGFAPAMITSVKSKYNDKQEQASFDPAEQKMNQISSEQKPAAKMADTDRVVLIEKLQNALKNLPQEETEALNKAWEQAPHLFEAGGESDPLWFLHICDPEEAAKRLALCWKYRDKFFGDRQYLPMNQTGEGALSAEDLKVLKTGFVAPIFDTEKGSVWLCFDRSRLDKFLYADDSRLRCIFYILTTVARQQYGKGRSQWGFIRVMQPNFRFNVEQVMSLLQDAFPMRSTQLHHACVAPVGALRTMRKELKPIVDSSIQDPELKSRAFWHIEASPAEVCEGFQKQGISKSMLPVDLGGDWSHDDFNKWLEDAREHEQDTPQNEEMAECSSPENLPEDVPAAVAAKETPESSLPVAGATAASLIDMAMEKLDDSLKTEYLEAKRRGPNVVELESNPEQYLAFANQDADAAARRLAAYWKKRISVFGEKGYLKIDQTGEGALGRGDMALLSGGFLVLLPESDSDHSILCYDGSRLPKAAKNSQLRVAFYWLKLVAENPKSVTEGLVILHLIDKLVTNSRDKRQCIGDVLSVMPIRVKEVHGIPMGSIRASDRSIGFAVSKLFGKTPTDKIISYAHPQEPLSKILLSHGIPERIAPKATGGSWGYESFVKWQELRTRFEWDLPPGPGNKDALHLFDFSNVKSLGDMTEEEKVERKRRMNVLHSRRKRERERIEIEVLQEQCAEFEHKNKLLSHDNVRLENMMETARTKIARIEQQGQASLASFPAAQSAPSMLQSQGSAGAPVAQGVPGLAAFTGGAAAPGIEALLLQQMQQQRVHEESSALQRMQLRHAAEQRDLLLQQQLQPQLSNPSLGIFADPLSTSLRQQSTGAPFLGMQQGPLSAAISPQFLASQSAPTDEFTAQLLARQNLTSMLSMQRRPSDQSSFDANRGPL